MFQFPPSASLGYFTHLMIVWCYSNRISPFGHTRVNALLAAHRALSWPFRPSSPACPKASISCPESLIITYFFATKNSRLTSTYFALARLSPCRLWYSLSSPTLRYWIDATPIQSLRELAYGKAVIQIKPKFYSLTSLYLRYAFLIFLQLRLCKRSH